MKVRDALEADAGALAAIADAPTDVMRNLVHDRTVRVAEDGLTDPKADVDGGGAASDSFDGTDAEDVLGFISFDARTDTVHVTQLDGTEEACKRLLGEPVRFADGEGMAVELLVTPGRACIEDAAQALGFDRHDDGPRFGDEPTVRYRLEP